MNLAVGFFDGVHLGHRRILAQADAALTFTNHPATVLAPGRVPPLLMPTDVRLAAIGDALGEALPGRASRPPGQVRALTFTSELAAMPPDHFAARLRSAYPDLGTVFCGPNWTYGANGAGTADTLRAAGFRVETVPFVVLDGAPVSSTRIRAALAAGRLDEAYALLDRPYSVIGTTFSGKGVGRALGRPTINLRVPECLVRLPLGVYAVETPLGRGVANYGNAPTLGERAWPAPVLEVHLLDVPAAHGAASALAGGAPSSLSVSFTRFIRPERTFHSLAELQAQIARDVAAASAAR
ncbi:MAG: bifunctional riboflavin kinase/FAD synthetase [Kiritimatiellae bacterium]|nr:bifunctional riboflavin kinase/FAD synthetase [Kiritimatiellia bacterium]